MPSQTGSRFPNLVDTQHYYCAGSARGQNNTHYRKPTLSFQLDPSGTHSLRQDDLLRRRLPDRLLIPVPPLWRGERGGGRSCVFACWVSRAGHFKCLDQWLPFFFGQALCATLEPGMSCLLPLI
ncbi:unnamed protein product [Calypogeia fissa]